MQLCCAMAAIGLQRRQNAEEKMRVGTGGIGLLWLYLPPATATEVGCSYCVCQEA